MKGEKLNTITYMNYINSPIDEIYLTKIIHRLTK